MRFIIIGNIGSDAGYWVIDSTGIHHVGGWGTGGLTEFTAALKVMSAATQLKTPGIAEAAVKSVREMAQRALAEHVKGSAETTVIVLAG